MKKFSVTILFLSTLLTNSVYSSCKEVLSSNALYADLYKKSINAYKELTPEGKGYALVPIGDYFSKQEVDTLSKSLFSKSSSGEVYIGANESKNKLDEIVPTSLSIKIKDYFTITAQALVSSFGFEGVLERSNNIQVHQGLREYLNLPQKDDNQQLLSLFLSGIRWTDGSQQLFGSDIWHYDGLWFNQATTILGEGTLYSDDKYSIDEVSAEGFRPQNIISMKSGESVVYSGTHRAQYLNKMGILVKPLLHKGPVTSKKRIFLILSMF